MKKLFSLVLVLALVLSLGVGVFAEQEIPESYEAVEEEAQMEANFFWPTPTKPEDEKDFAIKKWFSRSFIGMQTPAETFNFEITPLDGAPAVAGNAFSISVGQGSYGLLQPTVMEQIDLALPTYSSPGVYEYEIKEAGGNMAGVTYDGRTLILTVYVFNNNKGGLSRNVTLHDAAVLQINGENSKKTEGFYNFFKSSAFYVTKKVTGNMGDRNDVFDVTVTINAPAGEVLNDNIYYRKSILNTVGGTNVPLIDPSTAQVTLQMKHGDVFNFNNVPFGATYVVSEADYTGDGYDAADFENNNGTVTAINKTVWVINNKDQAIETGINLDNLPYILILGAATIGLFGFTAKKRFSRED